MPTIVRGNQTKEPSGLDKFLDTISRGASAATGVANLITLPKRLRLEGQRLDIAKTQGERAQQQLDVAEENREREIAGLFLNRIIPRTFENRNMLFDRAEAGEFTGDLAMINGTVDPELRAAAVTLGDVSTEFRERTREALAISLGIEASEISDRFVMSERNLQGVLDRQKADRSFAFFTDPNNAEAIDALELTQLASEASGVAGSTPSDLQLNKVQDDVLLNEMIRIDGTTGEISGMIVNNPTQFMTSAFEQNGLDAPLREFHGPSGELIMLPQAVWDEMFQAQVAQIITQENDYASTVNDAAQTLAEASGMPIQLAQAFVTGDVSEMPPELVAQYAPILEGMRKVELATVSTLMNTSATFQNFADMITAVNGMGTPDREKKQLIEQLAAAFSTVSPNIVIPRNVSWLQRVMGVMSFEGSPGRTRFELPPGADQPVGTGTVLRDPEIEAANLATASNEAMNTMLQTIVGASPAATSLFFNKAAEEGVEFNGTTHIFSPSQITAAKEQLELLRQQGTP